MRREMAEDQALLADALKSYRDLLGRSKDRQPQRSLGYETLARDGYQTNELIYAGINVIAECFSEAPLTVTDVEGNAVESPNVIERLRQPNPFMSEAEAMTALVSYRTIEGNAFYEKIRGARGGQVIELWPVRPDRIDPVPSDRGFLSHYELKVGGKTEQLPLEDVIHVKRFNPLNDYRGQSPLLAAARRLDADNELGALLDTVLGNLAVIPYMVKVPKSTLTDEHEVNRLRAWWRKATGKANRGTPLFTGRDVAIERLGMNFQEMNVGELNAVIETRILMQLGVHPVLVGAKSGLDRSIYNNYREARRHLHETRIASEHRSFSDALTGRLLLQDFVTDRNLRLRFDNSDVSALSEVREAEREQARADYEAGLITREEARARLGMPAEGEGVYAIDLQRSALPQPKAKPKSQRKAIGIDLLTESVGRIAAAKRYHDRIEAATAGVFKSQARDVVQALNAIGIKSSAQPFKSLSNGDVEKILAQLMKLEKGWANLAVEELEPLLRELLKESASSAAAPLGIQYGLDNERAADFIRSYTFKFTAKIAKTSADDVRAVILEAFENDLVVAALRKRLAERFDAWSEVRAKRVARSEVIRASNAGARDAYREAGIQSMQWLTSSDPCEFCQELNGVEVAVGEEFVALGGSVTPEGSDKTLTADYEAIEYPPLHPNCECTVVPVVA